MPTAEELTEALGIAEKAAGILGSERSLPPGLELVRREWLAGAWLGAYACQRGLAALGHEQAGWGAERKALLGRAVDLLAEVWMARNRPDDWPAWRRAL